MQEVKVLRIFEVCSMLSISRATLYRWLAAGHFPEPIHLGPKAVGWLKQDIISWLEGRRAA